MKASINGVKAIAEHEALRLRAYDDAQPNKLITSKSQVIGTLTIGYGHTKGVYVGQTITKQQAESFLSEDVQYAVNAVKRLVNVDINQNQLDALTSFVFNIGEGRFAKSTLRKLLNQKLYNEAAEQFFVWNKPSGIIGRRHKEYNLFMLDMFVLRPVNPAPANILNDIATIAIGAVLLG